MTADYLPLKKFLNRKKADRSLAKKEKLIEIEENYVIVCKISIFQKAASQSGVGRFCFDRLDVVVWKLCE